MLFLCSSVGSFVNAITVLSTLLLVPSFDWALFKIKHSGQFSRRLCLLLLRKVHADLLIMKLLQSLLSLLKSSFLLSSAYNSVVVLSVSSLVYVIFLMME